MSAVLGWAASVDAEDRENCLYCHRFPGLSRLDPETQRVRLFYIDPNYMHAQSGPHARLACTDCHEADAVSVIPHGQVRKVDCTRQCHIASPNQPERRFSHEDVARMLTQSVHKPQTLENVTFAEGPLLEAGQSQCLYCHDEPVFRDLSSILPETHFALGRRFDRCDVCHAAQVPVDTEFGLKHVASRLVPERTTLELAQACAVCHADPRVREEFHLPDSVASYVRSFHGKAALLGDEQTAGCVDCHVAFGQNVHLMLGPRDPDSSVSADNVANSCRSTVCHPGANEAIGRAAVHVDLGLRFGALELLLVFAFILITVISFVPSAMIVLLELIQVILGRHAHPSPRVVAALQAIQAHPDGRRSLQRFTRMQRVQHWILTVFFVLLCLTGFPMKFADQDWSRWVVRTMGGLDTTRWLHHWAGVLLVAGFLAHLVQLVPGYLRNARDRRPDGRRNGLFRALLELPMVMTPTDFKRGGALFAYLVGARKTRPTFGRFSVTEKFEYFGVLWGTTLLGLTGLMLWGDELMSHLFSGRLLNFALIAHTYEAFLAAIHVGILHIYNVILSPNVFPLSLATLTGRTPPAKLVEECGDFVVDTASHLGISVEGTVRG